MITTTTQTELKLRTTAPKVGADDVEQLASWLAGMGWQTARQIEAGLGIDERRLRAIAEHSDGQILSGPGCPGYRLFDGESTLDDASRAANRLISQARKMMRRAITIRNRAHRFVAGRG
jgi:hypothetical protein